MRMHHIFILVLAGLFLSTPVLAQQKTTRIAVIDTSRVFNEMQETKTLRGNLENERQRLQSMSTEKEAELKRLTEQRKVLKPDSAQYDELNQQIMKKAMEYEVWGKYAKMDAERSQKRQMKQLFDHIEAAVGEVAKQQGYDIVVANHKVEIPDSMEGVTTDQLRAVMNQRDVLYAAENVDISDKVLAVLDAKFKGAAPAGGEAPAR